MEGVRDALTEVGINGKTGDGKVFVVVIEEALRAGKRLPLATQHKEGGGAVIRQRVGEADLPVRDVAHYRRQCRYWLWRR